MNKSNPQCRVRQCFICDSDTVFFCFTCKQDLCESCRDNHLQDISTTYHDTVLYKLSKQRHGNYFSIFSTLPSTLSSSSIKIRTIRRRQAIMLKIQSDISMFSTQMSRYEIPLRFVTKAQHLTKCIDRVVHYQDTCLLNLQNIILRIKKRIARIQKYEHRNEKLAMKPTHFIKFIKTKSSKIDEMLNNAQFSHLSWDESINKEIVIQLFSLDISTRREKRGLGELISEPTLHDLIYIDTYNKIKILFESELITLCIEKADHVWLYRCVYSSISSGNLLVGMINEDLACSKITRYSLEKKTTITRDWIGKLIQTIQYDNKGNDLYFGPCYITENNNGDVVVSDWKNGVVVTDTKGRHRFTFKKDPCGSVISPKGICTDSMSHILVCVLHKVMMLDKDGVFLSYILSMPQGIMITTNSLSFDFKTHCLWVGSVSDGRVRAYRYLKRQDALLGMYASLSLLQILLSSFIMNLVIFNTCF